MPEWAAISVRVMESLAFLAFTASAVFTFFSQRLNYVLRWYMVTDRSLRIRSGVFNMQELTMTFSNIQEDSCNRRGPLQKLLKLADTRGAVRGRRIQERRRPHRAVLGVSPMQATSATSWWSGSANIAILA